MHPRTDPVGKIRDLYKEAEGQVPYLTFMHIFNDLLRDPMAIEPKEPTEELKEKFQAACMAAGMGVLDPEGRAAQRVKEFRERVVPAWQEFLEEQEFREMKGLLRGEALRRRRALRKEKEEESTHFDLERPASQKSSALLARLKLIDSKSGPQPDEGGDSVSATGTPRPSPRMVPPPEEDGLYESMSELCRAIREGQVEVAADGDEGRQIGCYRLNTQAVTVKLARASGQVYAVLTADVGLTSLERGAEAMDEVAEAMGFVKMAKRAYMRKQENRVHTLKAMKQKVSLACAVSDEDMNENIVSLLNRLHWDMGELIERMEQN